MATLKSLLFPLLLVICFHSGKAELEKVHGEQGDQIPVANIEDGDQHSHSFQDFLASSSEDNSKGDKSKGDNSTETVEEDIKEELKKWDDRPLRTVFTKRDALQAAMGRPNREQVVSTRPTVITTLEAINLANGPEVAKLMEEGTKHFISKPAPEIIDTVFVGALSRSLEYVCQRACEFLPGAGSPLRAFFDRG